MSAVVDGRALRQGGVPARTAGRSRLVSYRRRLPAGPALIFVVVFAAELAFGAWMAARGCRWNDAMTRLTSGMWILHSADPKLANVGFVWPPLPTLMDGLVAVFYPIWPGLISSGVAAAVTTAACAGATAAILLVTASRLGLSRAIGWSFALLVAVNPMVFLYGSNGMSEGVAAPWLVAAVCFLTLFWHTGERLWVAGAGVAAALGVASEYPAVPYGAAVLAALIGGVLWSSEAHTWAPQGRARAVEGLALLFAVPPVFMGLLWIGANAVIMGNPLDFVYGQYGYGTFQRASDPSGIVTYVTGDMVGALWLVGERSFPFLIPLAFVLLVRVIDRRFWRINTLSVILLGLSVPAGMVVPLAFLGSPVGFLRYLMFPLFVAAGWGLYEIAMSRRRRIAAVLILTGWLVAFPVGLYFMASPSLGPEEHVELGVLAKGSKGADAMDKRAPVARYLNAHILPEGRNVLFDSYGGGSMIALQIRPAYMRRLIATVDRRFKAALAQPSAYGVGYVLMPDPKSAPTAAIGRAYPRLWDGRQPGFRLVKTISTPVWTMQSAGVEKWRVYAVERAQP